jgi:hypothetical protein
MVLPAGEHLTLDPRRYAGVPCLLDVAVRRARGLGRGRYVASVKFFHTTNEVRDKLVTVKVPVETPSEFIDVDVLIPAEWLGDAYRLWYEILDELRNYMDEINEAKYSRYYSVNLKTIPVELQIAMRRVAETIIATVLSAREVRDMLTAGTLLVTCNPRAIAFAPWSPWSTTIHYYCKSHLQDFELKLSADTIFTPDVINIRIHFGTPDL